MTIEIYPYDLTPSSPIYFYQKDNEALERLLPWTADYIESVYLGSIINPNGDLIPIDWLPIDDIRFALATESMLLTGLGFNSGIVPQYRDDSSVWIYPGSAAHRGSFKIQPFDSGTGKTRVVDVGASLRDPVADAGAGANGLAPDTFYYGYIKFDVASAYPEYRWSKQPPTYEDGLGPEHPADTNLRFFGSLFTGPLPGAAILPHHRYGDGRVILRDVVVGPADPTTNLLTGDTGGWVPLALSEVPPTADIVFLSGVKDSDEDNDVFIRVRTLGDVATPNSGYALRPTIPASSDDRQISSAWMELPINTLDGTTDEFRPVEIEISVQGYESSGSTQDTLVLVGYRERI